MKGIEAIVELLKGLGLIVLGYWTSNSNSKKKEAEDKADKLDKYRKVDNEPVTSTEVYNANNWDGR